VNYDAAARIAHLVATRNLAIAALERAHCRNPLCCEAYQALRSEPAKPAQLDPAKLETLSVRQREVVELIAAGLMDKEVAERLGIGVDTVKTHWRDTMHKLGLRGRQDLHLVMQQR
jgi:DNA-binding NarL/FixJ family response regulator